MRVLVACEYSGTVRDAFIAAGHDAMSCDLLPTDKPGPHHTGDVFDLPLHKFDLLIGHPPCTFLSNSGVCHLHKDAKRWPKMFEAAAFFKRLLTAPVPRIAIENPVMHGYAKELIGGVKQAQTVQPWWFGHAEQKATCLWLKGLPLLTPTKNVKAEMMALPNNQRQRLFHLPPSKNRWKLRSTTYSGLAAAMATQWGYVEDNLLTLMESA
jgi:hypothetical protein